MKKIIEKILKENNMERMDLYEDDRVLQIAQEELKKYRNSRKPIGEVLDNLMYILVERIEIEEEQ